MTGIVIGVILIIFYIVICIFVQINLIKRKCYSRVQVFFQSAIIWLVPPVGPLLIYLFNKTDKQSVHYVKDKDIWKRLIKYDEHDVA